MALKIDLLRAAFMVLGVIPIIALVLVSSTLALVLAPFVLLLLCLVALAIPWPEEQGS